MAEPIRIHTPFTEEDSRKLKIGDSVLITGEIYAARDAAHKKMCEALANGEKLPIDWHDKMVYYLGPTPAKPGDPIGSCGPTTSGRMDAYAPTMMSVGARGMIGKGARLPEVRVVDMASQFRGGRRSVFSAPLAEALEGVRDRREKAVLLLNRRGFSNFLMCRDCGCVPECPHCSCALTYHERTHTLECHTCGRSWPQRAYPDPTTRCPNCGSRYMAAYGVGTERVEDELRLLLGDGVEVIRMDADATRRKGAHQELLERFDAAECAVLVGTQMIAKGLDFPEVTLVGVVNADTTLKLPDFRAAERTYDLLEQVAGRAGRGGAAGEVIIQTYWAEHPAIQAVARHDRDVFLAYELEDRRDSGYPPFSRAANAVVWGRDARAVAALADELARLVREEVGGEGGWEVLGPTDCVKARVKDRVRRHVVVKAPLDADLGPVLSRCAARLPRRQGIRMALDVDAYDFM